MTYTIGTRVSMEDFSQTTSERYGVCVEDECSSPSQNDPERKVVRIRWDHDESETIENTKHIY